MRGPSAFSRWIAMFKPRGPVSFLLAVAFAAICQASWAQQPFLPATAPGAPVVHHSAYFLTV